MSLIGVISDLHHQHDVHMLYEHTDVRLAVLSKLCFHRGRAGRENNSYLPCSCISFIMFAVLLQYAEVMN